MLAPNELNELKHSLAALRISMLILEISEVRELIVNL